MHAPVKPSKIMTLDHMAVLSSGCGVVLCHGTFDLLHLGHVKHLQAAKALGGELFVTVTDDRFVNKGPGRPVFPAQQRAEMIAALDCVDAVVVVDEATAIKAIEAIKPRIYVKGSDYENSTDANLALESYAVEAYGGKLVFTHEEQHSSSSLINRHVEDPELVEYLADVRSRLSYDSVAAMVDRVADLRILVVGDAIIDEYRYVEALGKSSKEPHLCVKEFGVEEFVGGSRAAAHHLNSFGDVHSSFGPEIRKIRYVDRNYGRKLFEIYQYPEPSVTPPEMYVGFENFDVVVVTDFGHGLIDQKMINELQDRSKFLAVNAQTNAGNYGFNLITKYTDVDYVVIDRPEAELALSNKTLDIEDVAHKVQELFNLSTKAVITDGRHGCCGHTFAHVSKAPAFTKTVVDTIGAGDAFFAITAPLAALGADMDMLTFVGSAAGAIKCGVMGHRSPVTKDALLRYAKRLLK